MTHDEFYSRLLENRRIIQPERYGLRRERRAWVSRASIADDPATAETQCDLWRANDASPPESELGDHADGASVGGRVVGRIAGGRIIPIGDEDA